MTARGPAIAEILDTAPDAFDGEVMDLAGKFVLPGLHDLHVHSYGNLGPLHVPKMLGAEEVA